jgi:hypothetical protein
MNARRLEDNEAYCGCVMSSDLSQPPEWPCPVCANLLDALPREHTAGNKYFQHMKAAWRSVWDRDNYPLVMTTSACVRRLRNGSD